MSTGPGGTDVPVPGRALAIGAHPDDIELQCGATLAKWADAGCAIHLLVLTDGSKGTWDPDEDLEALAARRAEEQEEAAGVLGARGVVMLGRVDGELEADVVTRREVVRHLRELRPEVLVGHDPWKRYRLHPDHRAAGWLTVDALVAARDPHFFADVGPGPHRPDALLLFEADEPNHHEDVTGFADRKIEALLAHRSQHRTTMGINGSPEDLEHFRAEVLDKLAEAGADRGVAHAEAFRALTDT